MLLAQQQTLHGWVTEPDVSYTISDLWWWLWTQMY